MILTSAAFAKANRLSTSASAGTGTVEIGGLHGPGDSILNATAVAQLRKLGEYASLILLMKCGNCGYESPVETNAGSLTRECYACGAKNTGHRAAIQLFFDGKFVQI